MTQTNWLPGIVVGAIGLVVGLVVLLATRRKAPASRTGTKLADLEQRVQLTLEQLRALESDRHQMGEETYAQEHQRLELEAAAALRARDEFLGAVKAEEAAAASAAGVPSPAPGAPAAPKGLFAAHPQLLGALWGAGVVLFFVGLGYFLTQWEHDRGNGEITGAGATSGPMAQQAPAAQPQEDPHFQAFYDRAKKNPQDTESAAWVAHELIRQQRFDEAEKMTNQALAADPFHLESRIHRAVLQATEGHLQEAIDALGHLARTYPDSYEALLFRGAIAMQAGESKVALESFERFSVEAPAEERPPQLDHAMMVLRQNLQGGGAAPARQ